jgi:U4/U6.U5 tri-snRNP component SNU23
MLFFLQEEKTREYRRDRRAEKKQKQKAEAAESMVGFEADADVAAMMGFSGFGSSTKK